MIDHAGIVVRMAGTFSAMLLQFFLISALLRGGHRRYPLMLCYAIAGLFAGLVQATGGTVYWQWVSEGVLQVMVFGVVVNLILSAMSGLSPRVRSRLYLLVGGSILIVGISFLAHFRGSAGPQNWMAAWLRDISFCAVVLNFALWVRLTAPGGTRDVRLLLLTAGLGIQFAGESIGVSLRTLSSATSPSIAADLLVMMTSLTSLYIFWQVFRGRALPLRQPAWRVEQA